MRMKNLFRCMLVALLVSACSKTQSQSQYNMEEVGQPITDEYAVVFNVRPVDIAGHTSGAGSSPAVAASVGGMTGPAGTYVGSEIGSIWGSGVGAAEQAAADKKGYEYTVVTEGGVTKTIVQYQNPEDIVFKPGDLVLLQNTGSFHRLLSTENLPEKIKKPHWMKIENPSLEAAVPPPAPPPAQKNDKEPGKDDKKPMSDR